MCSARMYLDEFFWEDLAEGMRGVPKEMRRAFAKMWVVVWLMIVVFALLFWRFFVNELRVNRSVAGRVFLMVFFMCFVFVEFVSFVKTLRTACDHTFSFEIAVMASVVLCWGSVVAFVGGLVWSVFDSVVDGHFRPPRLLRLLQPYHYCLPAAEMAFALAYSSPLGVFMATFRAIEVAYQNRIFRGRRPVRRYGKWP